MAEKLLEVHAIKLSAVQLVPSSGGIFDIHVGDQKVFSKFETERFPEPEEAATLVAKLLSAD